MYADHFGLNEDPFKIAPSLRFVHRGRNFQASFRALRAGLLGGRSVMLLESAPGLGKTALLKQLAEQLRERNLDSAFEACRSWTTADVLLRKDGPAILLLDEAHHLSERALADLLGQAAAANAKLAFAASPEFSPRIAHLEPLRRRLRPLPRREVVDYVRERLVAAGHPDGDIFTPEALVLVASASEGVPRLINRVCSTSLFMAAMAQEATVEVERVRETLATLGIDAPATLRPLRPKPKPQPVPAPAPDVAAPEPRAAPRSIPMPTPAAPPAPEPARLEAQEAPERVAVELPPKPAPRPAERPSPILIAERRFSADARRAYAAPRGRRRIPGGALGVASAAAAGSLMALLTFVEAPHLLSPVFPQVETVVAELLPAEPAPVAAQAPTDDAPREAEREIAASLPPPPPPVAPTPPAEPQPPSGQTQASAAPEAPERVADRATPAPAQQAAPTPEPKRTAEAGALRADEPARSETPPPVQQPPARAELRPAPEIPSPDQPIQVAEREAPMPAPPPEPAETAALAETEPDPKPAPRAEPAKPAPQPQSEEKTAALAVPPAASPGQVERERAPNPAPPAEPTSQAKPARQMAAVAPAAPARAVARDPLAASLEEARRHLAAGRLVEPAGENALESYRAALALQPWNAEARRGLDELAAQYVRLAETAETRGDWIGAVEHLETAQAIAPDHPDVMQLQETRRLAAAAVGPQQPVRTAAVEPPAAAAATAVAAAPAAVAAAPVAVAPPRRVAMVRPQVQQPGATPSRPAPRLAPSGPLDLAALDSAERVQAALARGADPNTAYDGLRRPLTIAAQRRRPDVVSVLLRNGADPNVQTRDAATPLMYAAWNGDLVTATFLLEAGARTGLENLDGKTPLMAAATRGHTAVAELLLRNGADPDAQSVLGWTALMYAAWSGHRDVAKLLLEQGADPAVRNQDGHTAAMLAEMRERPALARLMTVPTRSN